MSSIPFSTFQGYLKKLDLNGRPEIERALFKQVFPKFFTKREIEQAVREQVHAVYDSFWPFIQIEEDIDQPRRFAGLPSLPRGRYYTICRSNSGDDSMTLINELRAYRDPKTTGHIDVVDLAYEQLFGPPRPAFAVIVYDVDKMPFATQLLNIISSGPGNAKNLLVVEYPYHVIEACIKNTIDLRMPIAREWFFEQFSKEQDDGSIVWVTGQTLSRGIPDELRKKLDRESVTIVSRFKRKDGAAPMPRDFYAMLPTLVNPELGGGIASEGGGILEAIGTWMRRNEVGALIYPSARGDAFVELESGTVKNCGGWNLVDYRGTRSKNLKPFYIVPSPWAWMAFPKGVRIKVEAKDSTRNGSFQIIGMEAYWMRDYKYYLNSIETVNEYASVVGENILFGRSNEVTKAVSWRLGSSSIEWLTLNAVDKQPEKGARQKLLFSGLASKLDRAYAAGWIAEIEQELLSTGDISKALVQCMDIVDWIAKTWEDAGMSIQSRILVLSNRLHILRFFVAGSLLARKAGAVLESGSRERISALLGYLDMKSCTFSDNIRRMITTTLELGLSLYGGGVTKDSVCSLEDATDWQQCWDQMCGAVWEELCKS